MECNHGNWFSLGVNCFYVPQLETEEPEQQVQQTDEDANVDIEMNEDEQLRPKASPSTEEGPERVQNGQEEAKEKKPEADKNKLQTESGILKQEPNKEKEGGDEEEEWEETEEYFIKYKNLWVMPSLFEGVKHLCVVASDKQEFAVNSIWIFFACLK